MNGSNVSEAKTLEAVVVHLGYLTKAVEGVQSTLLQMATKEEISGLRKLIDGLATKDQLDSEVRSIREEVQRNKPSTLAKQVVVFCAGFAVVLSFLGLTFKLLQAMTTIVDRLPPSSVIITPPAKP